MTSVNSHAALNIVVLASTFSRGDVADRVPKSLVVRCSDTADLRKRGRHPISCHAMQGFRPPIEKQD